MRLDRNSNSDGRGKYALLKLRKIEGAYPSEENRVNDAVKTLERSGVLDWGDDDDSEFFVIRLKDINAEEALLAYADSAEDHDKEFASEVRDLASRAGRNHPLCQEPD